MHDSPLIEGSRMAITLPPVLTSRTDLLREAARLGAGARSPHELCRRLTDAYVVDLDELAALMAETTADRRALGEGGQGPAPARPLGQLNPAARSQSAR